MMDARERAIFDGVMRENKSLRKRLADVQRALDHANDILVDADQLARSSTYAQYTLAERVAKLEQLAILTKMPKE